MFLWYGWPMIPIAGYCWMVKPQVGSPSLAMTWSLSSSLRQVKGPLMPKMFIFCSFDTSFITFIFVIIMMVIIYYIYIYIQIQYQYPPFFWSFISPNHRFPWRPHRSAPGGWYSRPRGRQTREAPSGARPAEIRLRRGTWL